MGVKAARPRPHQPSLCVRLLRGAALDVQPKLATCYRLSTCNSSSRRRFVALRHASGVHADEKPQVRGGASPWPRPATRGRSAAERLAGHAGEQGWSTGMRPFSSEKEWNEWQRVRLLGAGWGQGRGRFKTDGSGRVMTPPASGKEFLSERQVQAGRAYVWRSGHIVQDMVGASGCKSPGQGQSGAQQFVGAFVWRLLCVAEESVSFRLEGKF